MFEIEYAADYKTAECNGLMFRRDGNTGYFLCSQTVNGKRPRLHRYVWEHTHGTIPDGMHVHHINKDKSNNAVENLTLLPEHEHISMHSSEPENVERSRRTIVKAREFAKEWHKSYNGREWHKLHYAESGDKLHERIAKRCQNCGAVFKGEKRTKFCGNACKSSYRRKAGKDNEKRICSVCGKVFEVSKYEPTRTCGRQCTAKLRQGLACPQTCTA